MEPIDDLTDVGNELGHINIIWTDKGWMMDIGGSVDAMMMLGAAGILTVEANFMHASNKAAAQQQARATGLVAARSIPQDHLKGRKS